MALVKCPDCGKEISDTAHKCINCGRNLKESSIIGVFVISFLIPILGIIVYLIGKVNNNDKVAKAGIKGFVYNIVFMVLISTLILINSNMGSDNSLLVIVLLFGISIVCIIGEVFSKEK